MDCIAIVIVMAFICPVTLTLIARSGTALTEPSKLAEIKARTVRVSELAGQVPQLTDIDPTRASQVTQDAPELTRQVPQLANVNPIRTFQASQGLGDRREGLLDVAVLQVQVKVRRQCPLWQGV